MKKKSALTLIEAARYGEYIRQQMQEVCGDMLFEPMERALSEVSHRVDHFCCGLFHASGFKHNLVVEAVGSTGIAATVQIRDADGEVLRTLRAELKREEAAVSDG